MPVAHIGPEFVSGSARLSAAALAKRQGLTGEIWKGLNKERALVDPGYGFFHLERWRSGSGATTATMGDPLYATQATTGTCNLIAGPDGFGSLLELDCNSTTAGQGIQVQARGLSVNPVAGMEISFEAMCRARDLSTTGVQHFIGLSDLETTIHASGVPTTGDKIGFASITNNLISEFVMNTSGVPAAATGTPHTWIDGDVTSDGTEWVKLGFLWRVDEFVRPFVQGVEFSSDLAISTDPAAAVCPSFVCQANTSIDPILEIAYYAFGYKYPA
jgi:hypothetical protein